MRHPSRSKDVSILIATRRTFKAHVKLDHSICVAIVNQSYIDDLVKVNDRVGPNEHGSEPRQLVDTD